MLGITKCYKYTKKVAKTKGYTVKRSMAPAKMQNDVASLCSSLQKKQKKK